MKRICLFILALFLIIPASNLFAQSASPLFQVMASGSLLNRPEEFISMHETLEKGDFDAIEVDKYINQSKLQIIDFLDLMFSEENFVFEYNNNKFMVYYYDFSSLSFKEFKDLSSIDQTEFYESQEITFNNMDVTTIKKEIRHQIKLIFNKTKEFEIKTNEDLDKIIVVVLREVASNMNIIIPDTVTTSDKAINLILDYYYNEFLTKTIEIISDENLEQIAVRLSAMKKEYFKQIYWNTKRAEIIRNLDIVEDQIVTFTDEVQNYLTSINLGIGFAETEGFVSPGFAIKWDIGKDSQVGFFINGAVSQIDDEKHVENSTLSKNESTSDQSIEKQLSNLETFRTLIGFQAGLRLCSKAELELLLSVYLNNRSQLGDASTEFGVGLNLHVFNKILFGPAYYYLNDNGNFVDAEYYSRHLVGLTISGNKSTSISVLIGYSSNGKNSGIEVPEGFIFQTNLPLNLKGGN